MKIDNNTGNGPGIDLYIKLLQWICQRVDNDVQLSKEQSVVMREGFMRSYES